MAFQSETRVTRWNDYPHFGMSQYRIWQRSTPFGSVEQRHEWRLADGSTEMDRSGWINGGRNGFLAHAMPVEEAS